MQSPFRSILPTQILMSKASQTQAQAQAATRRGRSSRPSLLGEDLTLEETLRVLDVARELRDRRETAEEMFRRDDLRRQLRDKLLQTARMAGEDVTEDEIEAAIAQYFDSLHTYEDPKPGLENFLAHCWVWRGRILAGAAALATVAGGFWFLFM